MSFNKYLGQCNFSKCDFKDKAIYLGQGYHIFREQLYHQSCCLKAEALEQGNQEKPCVCGTFDKDGNELRCHEEA